MYLSWVPQNTRLDYTPDTNETNPFHSCQGVQVPAQTWTQAPNTWDPISVWCLNLHLIPPVKVGLERDGTHDKRVISLSAPISKYVLRIISLWPNYHPQQWTVLNRHRRDKYNQSLAQLPNQVKVQIQIQSIVPPGLQLVSIYITCDGNMIIVTIIYFLSLVNDK
jgi:hypothetical protein